MVLMKTSLLLILLSSIVFTDVREDSDEVIKSIEKEYSVEYPKF